MAVSLSSSLSSSSDGTFNAPDASNAYAIMRIPSLIYISVAAGTLLGSLASWCLRHHYAISLLHDVLLGFRAAKVIVHRGSNDGAQLCKSPVLILGNQF